jgi:hypothetical protein
MKGSPMRCISLSIICAVTFHLILICNVNGQQSMSQTATVGTTPINLGEIELPATLKQFQVFIHAQDPKKFNPQKTTYAAGGGPAWDITLRSESESHYKCDRPLIVPNGKKEYNPRFNGEFKGSGGGTVETWEAFAKFKLNFNFQITGIDFQNNYDICDNSGTPIVSANDYEWTPTKQEPVVYKMNSTPKIKIQVKCVNAPLDGVQQIKLYCTGTNLMSLTFGSADTPVSLNFSGGVATTTMTAQSHVMNDIRKGTYVMNWKGDIEKVTINQDIYTTHNAPKCDKKLFRKDTIDKTVNWASGSTVCNTQDSPTNTVRKVQQAIKNEFKTHGYIQKAGIKFDPWTWIPKNKGDCLTYADWMTKSMQLLGVSATTNTIEVPSKGFFSQKSQPYWLSDKGDIDADGTLNENTTGYTVGGAGGRGDLKGIYIDAAGRCIWTSRGPIEMSDYNLKQIQIGLILICLGTFMVCVTVRDIGGKSLFIVLLTTRHKQL